MRTLVLAIRTTFTAHPTFGLFDHPLLQRTTLGTRPASVTRRTIEQGPLVLGRRAGDGAEGHGAEQDCDDGEMHGCDIGRLNVVDLVEKVRDQLRSGLSVTPLQQSRRHSPLEESQTVQRNKRASETKKRDKSKQVYR